MAESPLLFLAGARVPRCTHRVHKRFRGYATLQYADSGGVSLAVGRERFALSGRWFWSAWDGPLIAFHPADERWSHRYIAFRGPLLERWASEGLFPIRPQPAPSGGSWARRFDELLEASRDTGRWTHRRAINRLESLLIDLAEARQQPDAPPLMLRLRDKLVASAAACDDVGESLGLPPRTLRRRFRRQFGASPHQFRIAARLAEARRLLTDTDRPIKQIADELGYADVFYFARQFRKLVGVPPGAYRRSREG